MYQFEKLSIFGISNCSLISLVSMVTCSFMFKQASLFTPQYWTLRCSIWADFFFLDSSHAGDYHTVWHKVSVTISGLQNLYYKFFRPISYRVQASMELKYKARNTLEAETNRGVARHPWRTTPRTKECFSVSARHSMFCSYCTWMNEWIFP